MINSILEAISIALNAEFGDDYKIYTEDVKQGLTEPCFFIYCVNPTHTLYLGLKDSPQRYYRENQFCIQYFPADAQGKKEECNTVAERLEFCLEWITVADDLVMGSKMQYEVVDGILFFFVNYNLFVRKETDSTAMEEFIHNQDVGE